MYCGWTLVDEMLCWVSSALGSLLRFFGGEMIDR